MSHRARWIVVLLVLDLGVFGRPASALWGKATTQTEQGNAQMNLGEYTGLKHAIGC